MLAIQQNILEATNKLPYYYQQDLLDYAIFLKSKADKESDTEYLEKTPSVIEEILTASKESIENCSLSLEWQ